MNISATAAMGYTYTNIKTGVSQKKDVSNENTCEKQTQKEYKNVVKESISRSIRIPHLM